MEQILEMSEKFCTKNYILGQTVRGNRFIYLVNSKKLFELNEHMYHLLKSNIGMEVNFPCEIKQLLNEEQKSGIFTFENEDNFLNNKILSKLVLVLTNQCNLKCLYCYANGGSYNQDQMVLDKSTIESLFTFLSTKGIVINKIMLFGGEPLLATDQIKNVLSIAKGNELVVDKFLIVTNFTILTEEQIKLLIDNHIHITVSLDGPKILNDQLRKFRFNKNKSVFSEVKKNIKRFQQAGGVIESIEVTYTKKHEQFNISKREVIKFLKEEFDIDNVLIYDALSTNKNDSVSFNNIRVEDYFMDDEHLHPNDLKCIDRLFNETCSNHKICGAGNSILTVLPNGNIYPCQLLTDDSFLLGNINEIETGYREKNQDYNEKINNLQIGLKCSNCFARNYCVLCAYYKLKYDCCELMKTSMLQNISKIVDKKILQNLEYLI